jgi:hypothetical protein
MVPKLKKTKTFSNLRPSKIQPKRDFWFENKPSGNPAKHALASKSSACQNQSL